MSQTEALNSIESSIAKLADTNVTLIDREKVETFIRQSDSPQDFANWITDLVEQVKKYFQEEAISLKFVFDRESPELSRLVLLINTKQPFQEAREKLDEFLDKVWYEDMSDFTTKLAVNLAFK